jgi:hypothetical protein
MPAAAAAAACAAAVMCVTATANVKSACKTDIKQGGSVDGVLSA